MQTRLKWDIFLAYQDTEFSAGIEYVMVNGTFVLKNGKTVSNVFAGQAVYGKFKK